MKRTQFFVALLGVIVVTMASAEIYELPPEGYDVVGAVVTISARHEDTLIDIAREGTEVILPTRFVLPAGLRRGVILNLAEYRLYYFPESKPGETAYVMTYPISIGRMDWETPLGLTKVISKVRNPSWYVPQSVLDEHVADGNPLPRIVPPGPDNPLGKYAMRLGLPGYLIHGTNRPAGVGMRVTHGCVRMFPEDIEYLFAKVDVNTPVRIVNDPVKMGWDGNQLVMEVHPILEVTTPEDSEDVQKGEGAIDSTDVVATVKDPLTYVTEQFIVTTGERAGQLDWHLAEQVVDRSDGIPTPVGEEIKNAAASAAFQ
jgi:L,D-transpeptidase ErfK/SrfK